MLIIPEEGLGKKFEFEHLLIIYITFIYFVFNNMVKYLNFDACNMNFDL